MRAFIVYDAKIVADLDAVIQEGRSGHDIFKTSLAEKLVAELPVMPHPGTLGERASTARIRKFGRNELIVETTSQQSGLLVLSEAWYPGWKAEVNGKVYDAIPANGWMRAFPIPSGSNTVRVFFEQHFLVPGALITGVALCALVTAVAVRPVRRSPTRRVRPSPCDLTGNQNEQSC